jgi:hypothetical protein
MPQLCVTDVSWDSFWTSYMQAYFERDVRELVALNGQALCNLSTRIYANQRVNFMQIMG